MISKKKLLTSGIALTLAAAIGLGGTFAWQSISQTAVDESSDIVNPGGRLHNDQWFVNSMENNNDIYVENFTTVKDDEAMGTPIYARVKLEEYMEIVLNHGTAAQKVVNVAGQKLDKETGEPLENQNVATEQGEYDYEYVLHDFGGENATDSWWTWKTGKTLEANGDAVADANKPYYMPTFNTNKDSIAADLNGQYVDAIGGISNREKDQYRDYNEWAENDKKVGYEIWDNDSDLLDELEDLSWDDLNKAIDGDLSAIQSFIDSKDIKTRQIEHTAKQVGDTKGLISMADWLKLRDALSEEEKQDAAKVEEKLGKYWVYDTDGWVYWSSPIASGEATGLLLDGMKLNGVMDDTWYYDVKVTAQFVTANDVGKYNATGFYSGGDTVTTSAEILLKTIGVEMDDVKIVTALSELKDEIANAKSGDNIVVDNNIVIRSAEAINFTAPKNDDGSNAQITLTLNGKTIQRSSGKLSSSPNTFFIIADGVDLTIDGSNGGGMRCDTTNLRGMCAKNGATITVNGGGEYMGSVIAGCAYANSKIIINNGTWRMRGNDMQFQYNYLRTYNNGEIIINGGTLISNKCVKGNVKLGTGCTLVDSDGDGKWFVVVKEN